MAQVTQSSICFCASLQQKTVSSQKPQTGSVFAGLRLFDTLTDVMLVRLDQSPEYRNKSGTTEYHRSNRPTSLCHPAHNEMESKKLFLLRYMII
jgi:hypothetical protein